MLSTTAICKLVALQAGYVIGETHKKCMFESQFANFAVIRREEIWDSQFVTMTSRRHLPEELRWRAIGRQDKVRQKWPDGSVLLWFIEFGNNFIPQIWRAGGSAKDGQPLMTDICRYAHEVIELRLNSDPPLLQRPEGWCHVEGFTKVVCTRGDQLPLTS